MFCLLLFLELPPIVVLIETLTEDLVVENGHVSVAEYFLMQSVTRHLIFPLLSNRLLVELVGVFETFGPLGELVCRDVLLRQL